MKRTKSGETSKHSGQEQSPNIVSPARIIRKRKLSMINNSDKNDHKINNNNMKLNIDINNNIDNHHDCPPNKRQRILTNVDNSMMDNNKNNTTANNNKNKNKDNTNTKKDNTLLIKNNPNNANISSVKNSSNTTSPNNAQRHLKRSKDNKKKRKKRKKTKAISTPKKPLESLSLDDLKCRICFELPPAMIYQCRNAHLLCADCWGMVRQSKRCQCPTCRIKMCRRVPSRNRLAEKYLAAHLFPCNNEIKGCKEQIQFAYLKQHESHECRYRTVDCKFHLLGCDWSGLAKLEKKHNKECSIRKTDVTKILKLVEQKAISKKQREDREMEKLNKKLRVCDTLMSRARNIVIKDLVINTSRYTNDHLGNSSNLILNSNIFNVLEHRWQIQMRIEKIANPKNNNNNNNHCATNHHNGNNQNNICNTNNGNNNNNSNNVSSLMMLCNTNGNNNNNNGGSTNQNNHGNMTGLCRIETSVVNEPFRYKLSVRLQCMNMMKKRLFLEVILLNGPDFGYKKSSPIQFESEISKKGRDSKWIDFVGNDDNILLNSRELDKIMQSCSNNDKLNLRIVIRDARINGVSREFRGYRSSNYSHHANEEEFGDETDEEMDSEDDLESLRNSNNNNNNVNNANTANTGDNDLHFLSDSSDSELTDSSDEMDSSSDLYSTDGFY